MKLARIAITGCVHGQLNLMYDMLAREYGDTIDLVLCTGDFEALRYVDDLEFMACPKKYRKMNDFHEYYNGKRKAPYLTLFIGGNHEASNYLSELPYGGWVAENIYYMGESSVLRFGEVRIAGITGIFHHHDYRKGHIESFYPMRDNRYLRSFYQTREIDVEKLLALEKGSGVDIIMSHDWPSKIAYLGDVSKLKRHIRDSLIDVGCPGNFEVLKRVAPSYWVSGHMHNYYTAEYKNEEVDTQRKTRFIALDKVEGRGRSIELLELEVSDSSDNTLRYDAEWLGIVKRFHPHRKRGLRPGWRAKVEANLSEQQFLPPPDSSMEVPRDFHLVEKDNIGLGENVQTRKLSEFLDLDMSFSGDSDDVDSRGGAHMDKMNPDEIDIDTLL